MPAPSQSCLHKPPWPAVVGWAAFVASLGAASLAALQWMQSYLANHGDSDFKIYYLAARIGVTRGWQHIYDQRLEDAGWKLLGDGFSQLALPDRLFLSPPLVAWIATPRCFRLRLLTLPGVS